MTTHFHARGMKLMQAIVLSTLVGGAVSAAKAQTSIDFAALPTGSLSGISGATFSLTGSGASGTPYNTNASGLWNSPNGSYPTNTILEVDFATAVSNLLFQYNPYGINGNPAQGWSAYDSLGALLDSGAFTSGGLASYDLSGLGAIDRLEFCNGANNWSMILVSLSWGPSIQELELSSSAIPLNLAIGQIAGNVHNQGSRGINSRLLRSRGKTAADTNIQKFPVSFNHSSTFPTQESAAPAKGANVVASGDKWESFASASFGDVGLDNLGANPGIDASTYGSTVGFEYTVNEQWALGLGWSHTWNDNTMNGGLGSVDIEGDAAILYAAYSKNNCWADMLYSYGSYDADIRRNNGGGTSVAAPEIEAHQLSLNTGYNFEAEISSGCFAPLTAGSNRLVYGPTLGVDYSIGALDGYAETGSPGFDAAFSEQNYDSLITRVGGQATHSTSINWGQFKSQLRLEYARENRNQGNSVNGSLVSNPLITATQSDISPGQDWLEAGAGISLDVANSNVTVYVDYTGQYFRNDATAHYATIGAQIKF